jgi:hypothetical protein
MLLRFRSATLGEEAHAAAVERAPDMERKGRALVCLGEACLARVRPLDARAHFRSALDVARAPTTRAEALEGLAEVARASGEKGAAVPLLEAAMDARVSAHLAGTWQMLDDALSRSSLRRSRESWFSRWFLESEGRYDLHEADWVTDRLRSIEPTGDHAYSDLVRLEELGS